MRSVGAWIELEHQSSHLGFTGYQPCRAEKYRALAAKAAHERERDGNSSLTVGDNAMLKVFRRISGGVHPETEMGRHLTAQGFTHAPQLLGDVNVLPRTGRLSHLPSPSALSAMKVTRGPGSWTA